jgi:hypothetical protein
MFHRHDNDWLVGREDPGADRNRAHLVALREARTATEYRAAMREGAATAAPVRRFALGTAGTSSNVDLAACCA